MTSDSLAPGRMTPHYADASVTVYAGDCLDVVRELPAASVDAVVTDPPYAINFMGRKWDRFDNQPVSACEECGNDDPAEGYRLCSDCLEDADEADLRGAAMLGQQAQNWHAKATHTRGYADNNNTAFQRWCELWAAECLRVLRPGGHLLAFGGTRTWHRLACAIEDAGFEVRDSIAWMYGSGFPKSLDVSKAIDKAAGAEREEGTPGRYSARRPAAEVETNIGAFSGTLGGAASALITAPATDAAREWQGWGTALKPAHEPIVVARKPLNSPGVNVLLTVESSLREQGVKGEIRWTSGLVNGAGQPALPRSSSSTDQRPVAETSAAHADERETPNDAQRTDSGSATSTPPGGPLTATTCAPTESEGPPSSGRKSSTPTERPVRAATSGRPTSSPSTTSTAEEQPTAKPLGARSTSRSSERDSPRVTESFAGTATGLTGSWTTVRIERLADGSFLWPEGLPRSTAGGSTVAANVLAHGTGALNIDGCRVEATDKAKFPAGIVSDTERVFGGGAGMHGDRPRGDDSNPAGRWPPNVVLDESQAAALDTMAPLTGASSIAQSSKSYEARNEVYGKRSSDTPFGHDDQGGASRFFYTAKADAGERVRIDGIAHPTVKPLSLMRWLVRLVCPPGGVVLDPFAGSGTTVEACILEGFRCIAVEREADYLPLITQRIHRRRDPVAAVRATDEDPGLFGLLDDLDGGAA